MASEDTNRAATVRPRLGDSDAEASFDALTLLVAQSLRMPTGIVCATLGAGREDCVDTETPRVESPDMRWTCRPSDILMLVP